MSILYCLFDPRGFESEHSIRFQDQWFQVAKQLQHASGQRSSWVNTPYPKLEQDIQVLDSQQWIQDITFPARLYLKTLGVENLKPEEIPATQEPLLLDGLGRYAIRHFLQQHEAAADANLLMDQLPIGKVQDGVWQMSVLEQQRLLTRLQRSMRAEATATTQQVWKVNEHFQINVTLAKYSAEKWVSVEASSARAKRRAKVWLEVFTMVGLCQFG